MRRLNRPTRGAWSRQCSTAQVVFDSTKFTWKQYQKTGGDQKGGMRHVDLTIPVPKQLEGSNIEVEVSTASSTGKSSVQLFQGPNSIGQWELFGEVVPQARSSIKVTTESTLTVELDKIQGDAAKAWVHPLNIPLSAARCEKFPFYTTSELDALLAEKLEPLPVAEVPKEGVEPGKMFNLGDVTSSSTNPLTIHELKRYREEEKEMEEKLQQLTDDEKRLSRGQPTKQMLEDQKRSPVGEKKQLDVEIDHHTMKIAALGLTKGVSLEIRRRRSLPVTVKNYIETLELELQKAITLRGQMNFEPGEAWASDAESKMSKEELFRAGRSKLMAGMAALQAARSESSSSSSSSSSSAPPPVVSGQDEQDLKEGIHLLRCLAIHHHSPRATHSLNDYYTRFNMLPWGTQLLLKRAQTPNDKEPSTNLMIGDLHTQGHPYFAPFLPLAIYFLQRAVEGGAHRALCQISDLLLSGKPHQQTPEFLTYKPEVKRGLAFLDLAEDRGVGEAYWRRFQIHVQGLYGQSSDHATASRYAERAFDAIPTLEKQYGPKVEEMLKGLKK